MPTVTAPSYLAPYEDAARQFGAGFKALLWANPSTQRSRFDAICRIWDLRGKSVLDAGCGRGDLLQYLMSRNIHLRSYIGLEGVESLAIAAGRKSLQKARIIHGDFVSDPGLLSQDAQVIVFSGSLNTLAPPQFYQTLRVAFAAAREAVVFNFLSSPVLAGKDFLVWHHADAVLSFARRLSPSVRVLNDYLWGDCTIAMGRNATGSSPIPC